LTSRGNTTEHSPFKGNPIMNKINKINPIAKDLRDNKFRKRIVEDKRNKKREKEMKREIADAKTKQDT
jgi:hypothetical protein